MRPATWLGGGLCAASFALTAALYARLPDAVPTHLGIDGADGFVAKPVGPFVVPLLGLLAYAITARVLARMGRARDVVPVAMAAFFLVIVVVMLRAALGDAPDGSRTIAAAGGVLLAVVGNYFGTLRRNHWVGIRTPWTLADDEVWRRTHRLAGWLLVAGGPLTCVAALAGAPFAIAFAPTACAALVSTVYSYVIYRRVRATGALS